MKNIFVIFLIVVTIFFCLIEGTNFLYNITITATLVCKGVSHKITKLVIYKTKFGDSTQSKICQKDFDATSTIDVFCLDQAPYPLGLQLYVDFYHDCNLKKTKVKRGEILGDWVVNKITKKVNITDDFGTVDLSNAVDWDPFF